IWVDGDVAEFSGRVVVSSNHFAIHDDAGADAVADGDVDEIPWCVTAALPEPHLGERAGNRGVLDLHCEACGGGNGIAYIDVAPAELRCVQHASGFLIDHARHDESNSVALARGAVCLEQSRD